MFPYGVGMDRSIKMKWRGDNKETSEIKNSGMHVFSYGVEMDEWIKRKWRGERKETSEIRKS